MGRLRGKGYIIVIDGKVERERDACNIGWRCTCGAEGTHIGLPLSIRSLKPGAYLRFATVSCPCCDAKADLLAGVGIYFKSSPVDEGG